MLTLPLHPLPDHAVLLLDGPDAQAFLHGQVTADVLGLPPGRAGLAALCSPQGRVAAVLHFGRTPMGLAIVLRRELAAQTAERLRRYVLRAKVAIRDASGELAVAGLHGLPAPGLALPGDWQRLQLDGERSLIIAAAASLAEGTATAHSERSWDAHSTALGEPEVCTATSEAWVPQMLNLDLLGAVSLGKGCYTGQEIVARVQYLGRIKRRMFRYRFAGAAAPVAGSTLFHGETEVARVVRVAGGPVEGELLAVAGVESAGLTLTDAQRQVTCTARPLPYSIPEAAAIV